MQFRNEEKTVDGNVKGSYGYKDANGMYRMVNYYVDANGFHAKVFSNEVSQTMFDFKLKNFLVKNFQIP